METKPFSDVVSGETVALPAEVYESDLALGEYIFGLNERLAKLNHAVSVVKSLKEAASNLMLDRLAATGQKHFAFSGLGTFTRVVSKKYSFPSDEQGGREAAAAWVSACMEAGLLDINDVFALQQARLVTDSVASAIEAAEAYNLACRTEEGKLPPSPFGEYEQVSLRTPTKRK